MPKVIAKIRQEAPNLKVSLDSAPKRHFDALVAGDVHFALSSHQPPSSEQNIYRMVVAKRTFRLLMNRYHPLADLDLTPESLAEFDFGQVSLQGEKRLSFEHEYQELELANKKSVYQRQCN
nr:LysR substrate-binding domain-containing protein [Pseudoalteromonas sp. MM17-2]